MKQKLLLLQDVDGLGRKGDVVTAKPGFVRNFLLPQRIAEVASAHVLRKQERLREERAKQAVVDKAESEALATQLEALSLEIRVKVDPEGHMYGSVSATDVAALLKEKGFAVERKMILLPRPLKETGAHILQLRLKEGVPAKLSLALIPEGMVVVPGTESVTAPIPPTEEPPAQE